MLKNCTEFCKNKIKDMKKLSLNKNPLIVKLEKDKNLKIKSETHSFAIKNLLEDENSKIYSKKSGMALKTLLIFFAFIIILSFLFFTFLIHREKTSIQNQDTKIKTEEKITDKKVEDENSEEKKNYEKSEEKIENQPEKTKTDTEDKNIAEKADEIKKEKPQVEKIKLDSNFKYAEESAVHDGEAILYRSSQKDKKDITICVNAGHGSSKSTTKYTYCNPSHLPKFVSGSTKSGKLKAAAATSGTTMANGESEAAANLKVAMNLKKKLLNNGYDVLMIRETDDVDLDNIARTVIANNYANAHIAIHFDGTASDKGAFCINVPKIDAYRQMEPVKSTWVQDNNFAKAIVEGLRNSNVKIYSDGFLGLDLVQTSFSTIPTTDVELGDTVTDYSKNSIEKFTDGILDGINIFFSQNK